MSVVALPSSSQIDFLSLFQACTEIPTEISAGIANKKTEGSKKTRFSDANINSNEPIPPEIAAHLGENRLNPGAKPPTKMISDNNKTIQGEKPAVNERESPITK